MSARAAAAMLLAVVCGLAALGAWDAVAWRDALERGDRQYERAAGTADWSPATRLPGDPVGSALELDDDLGFRRALQAFVVAERTPRGFDNGERRAQARAVAAGLLGGVATREDAALASRANDLLGVLTVTGGEAEPEQALAFFEAAVQAEGSNSTAKYNLELLLRRIRATGTRPGPSGGSGARGGRGAGSARAGTGY